GRRRHTRFSRDWSSDVCSSDLAALRLRDEQWCARPGERIGRRDHDGAGGIAAADRRRDDGEIGARLGGQRAAVERVLVTAGASIDRKSGGEGKRGGGGRSASGG